MAHVLTKLTVLPRNDCAEATELARELGLELQASRYEKPLAEAVFTALTADEVIVWSRHCPTRYVPGGGSEVRALEQYAFDSVPIEVMRHWKAIKDNYSFDRYEVWTTEHTPRATDPLLIGVLGQRLYLLARWGLESPDSASLKSIAKEQAERMWATCYRDSEQHGFFWSKTRYLGTLCCSWEDAPFQAARRVSGWMPT